MNLGPTELIIILAIVILLFGARKLPELAGSIGKSIKEFRKASEELDEDETSADGTGDDDQGLTTVTTEAPVPGEMTLLEHLNELRTRLVKVSIAIVLGTAVGYAVFPQLLDLLIEPYCSVVENLSETRECNLIILRPLEAFSVRIKVSMLVGVFLGGPVIFWQLWRFIVPGLTDRERKLAAPFVFLSQVLFGIGIAFAWFILPNALGVLTSLGGPRIVPNLTAAEYISFILTTSVAFGVVFLLPVVLTFLSLLGVLTAAAMRTARPYAVVGVAIMAAVITPTTDPVTMLLMMAPMVIFYEVSILFAVLFERRRRKRAATPLD